MRRLIFQNVARGRLTEPPPAPDEAALAELAANLGRVARKKLGRSLAIREIDAGSCNACELEIHALNNAFYDLERFGLRFVASPRHADVLLVTGPVTKNMREALGAHLRRDAGPEMGGGGRKLRRGWRHLCRELRGRGRRVARGAGRSAYKGLPAEPGSLAQGTARPHFRRLTCRAAGRAAARFAFVPSLRTIQAGA